MPPKRGRTRTYIVETYAPTEHWLTEKESIELSAPYGIAVWELLELIPKKSYFGLMLTNKIYDWLENPMYEGHSINDSIATPERPLLIQLVMNPSCKFY
jgi:hypothetical protein